jgi:hypothetical protein
MGRHHHLYIRTIDRENTLFFIVVVENTFPRYAGIYKCQEEQRQRNRILLLQPPATTARPRPTTAVAAKAAIR